MQTCRLIDSQKCRKIPNIWVNYWIWCYQNITKTGTNNCYFTVFESQQFKLNCFRFAFQKIIVKLLNTLSCLLSSNNNKDGLLRGWAWRWIFLCPVVGWSSALTSNHWYSLSIVKPVTFLVSELLKLATIEVDEDTSPAPFHEAEKGREGRGSDNPIHWRRWRTALKRRWKFFSEEFGLYRGEERRGDHRKRSIVG